MLKENQSKLINNQSLQNTFPVSEIIDGKLIFDDPKQADIAMRLGAFYLKIPSNLDLRPGIRLAHNFYKDLNIDAPDYTGYKQRSFEKSTLGYADRPDQVEQFQLELSLWDECLPKEVCDLLYIMNTLSVQILENVLEYSGISKDDWDLITGGALENKAGHTTTINHYRTEKEAIGIVGHKDSGFVTLLYANLPGYELKLNGEWFPMDPKDGCFLVNLGQVFEILTKNLKNSIIAPVHRVRQMYSDKNVEDRISFTIFITPRYDSNIYQYDTSGSLGIYGDYMSFLKDRFRKVKYANHRIKDKDDQNQDLDGPSNKVNKLSSLYDE